MSRGDTPEALLITMPWATSIHPSLGLGLLAAILSDAHLPTRTLYGNLLLPRAVKPGIYTINDPGQYEDRSAGLAFVSHLFPHVDPEVTANAVADRYMGLISRDGQLTFDERNWNWRREPKLRERLMQQTMEDIDRASVCLNRCMERMEAINFDVAGFSLTFETQLVSSLALARLIKKRWPERHVVFGGAACTSIQGTTILQSFDFIDVVCLGEGDSIIVDLVQALRESNDLEHIKGIAYRRGADVKATPRLQPIRSLDWLPLPEYDSYYEQKAASEWADSVNVLLFETSRGCWWGEKHLCSFCGLNGESLAYRAKSAEKTLTEIREFNSRWPRNNGLQAVDNIFPSQYFSQLLPALAEQQKRQPVGLFFEIKSNLKRGQFFQLASAGITALQPGIESFSDHILKLMDKGATTLQQICCLKWAQESGVRTTYNILLRNPGETVQDYQQILEVLPFISHLVPPFGIANMQLERYSPYFIRPEQFGIRNVRPLSHYHQMFPDDRINLSDLVYQFEFDHDELDQPELVAARRKVIEAMLEWKNNFKPGRLRYYVRTNCVNIVDKRDGVEKRTDLPGLRGEIYQYLEEPRTLKYLAARFPGISTPTLQAYLERLVRRRFVYHDCSLDKYLSVAVRAYSSRAEYIAEMNLALQVRPGTEKQSAAEVVTEMEQVPLI